MGHLARGDSGGRAPIIWTVRMSSSNGASMALSAPPEFASPLGRPVPRTEDGPLVTGQGRYVADLKLEGAAQVVFVNSPIAHARIASVDVTAARAAPGVLAVVTAGDLGLEPARPLPMHDQRMVRPWLADGVVRYVGEPVVALVADEQARAVDAAELVEIDYDPLEAVVSPREAATDQVLLFPEAGTNTCMRLEASEDPGLFDDCEVVVELSMAHPRLAACPIEPRCAAAAWGEDGRLGGRRDGMLLAYRMRVVQDAGAYPLFAGPLVMRARVLASGVYAIGRVECSGRAVLTNATPTGPVRGAGRPEANIVIERAVERFATEIGMDPAEVRRRNLVPRDAFPWTTPTGAVYDSGDYQALLDSVIEAGSYGELRAEQARRREAGDPVALGVGLGMFVEVADGVGAGEYGAVEITAGGGAIVRSGASPHGQGHRTTWAQLASDRLGIPMDRIEVRSGDTDEIPAGIGTFASRSAQAAGTAVHRAAVEVVVQARRLAAELLEVDPEDVVLDRAAGRLHLAGLPERGHTWAELAAAAAGRGDGLAFEVRPGGDGAPGPSWPSGAVLAAVAVDTETGEVRIDRLVSCDDAGHLLNPLLVRGQVHGALALGVAHALFEEFSYDEDGNPKTANFGDYAVITADVLPRYQLREIESPASGNELGVKGVGEAGTVGTPAAILNAVVDALAHLGVRHLELPATPERVLRAIIEATGEESGR